MEGKNKYDNKHVTKPFLKRVFQKKLIAVFESPSTEDKILSMIFYKVLLLLFTNLCIFFYKHEKCSILRLLNNFKKIYKCIEPIIID